MNQQIIACTNQIHIQQDMITHKTIQSLVIGYCVSRSEFNDYLAVSIARQSAFYFVEEKYITSVCEKLEVCL